MTKLWSLRLINGKVIAQKIQDQIKEEIKDLRERINRVPGLVSVIIGEDPVSHNFVKVKGRVAQNLGFNFERKAYPANFDPRKIIAFIKEKNADQDVHGIIVQLPLPEGFDQVGFLKAVHPYKDVDCLHPKNLGFLLLGEPIFLPPTVKAVLKVLENEPIDIIGQKVVFVGGGLLVGTPLSIHLSHLGATVTVVHEHTKALARQTKQGDILITGAGQMGLIKRNMVKENAYVLDFGTVEKDGKIYGDVDLESVSVVAKAVTPVPGGMGPITVACLMENVWESFKRSLERKPR